MYVCLIMGQVAGLTFTVLGGCIFVLEIIVGNGSLLVLSFAGAGGDGFAKLDRCITLTYTRVNLLYFDLY